MTSHPRLYKCIETVSFSRYILSRGDKEGGESEQTKEQRGDGGDEHGEKSHPAGLFGSAVYHHPGEFLIVTNISMVGNHKK